MTIVVDRKESGCIYIHSINFVNRSIVYSLSSFTTIPSPVAGPLKFPWPNLTSRTSERDDKNSNMTHREVSKPSSSASGVHADVLTSVAAVTTKMVDFCSISRSYLGFAIITHFFDIWYQQVAPFPYIARFRDVLRARSGIEKFVSSTNGD